MKKRIIVLSLAIALLSSFYSSQVISINDNVLDSTKSANSINITESVTSPAYDPSDPISIDSDEDFTVKYSFPGNGTVSHPYMIENLNITNSTTLIYIQDTTVYFNIKDNLLNGVNGSSPGIYLENVLAGFIEGNNISNCSYGIYLDNSSNISITNNDVYSNKDIGAYIHDSDQNNFTENRIYSNGYSSAFPAIIQMNFISRKIAQTGSGSGMVIDPSDFNRIIDNNVSYNCLKGIYMADSNDMTITGNNITNNGEDGIFLYESDHNTISGNNISRNGIDGSTGCYSLSIVHKNSISGKIAQTGSGSGMVIDPSDDNTISFNNFTYNGMYGINLTANSANNLIIGNNFIQNNYSVVLNGYSQANDNGKDNTFKYNYWDDHNNIDADKNCIADNPYSINGSANSRDLCPKTNETCSEAFSASCPTAPGMTFSILVFSAIALVIVRKWKKDYS